MRRLATFLCLAVLAACAGPLQEAAAPEPVFEAAPAKGACLPGDDDGIGGTGCPVD